MPTTRNIPGLTIDDSPDRPPYKPRITFDQSAAAARAALAVYEPERLAEFEAEFHAVMAEADDDFDLSRVENVVRRWWGEALLAANPDHVVDYIHARVKAGDDSVITKTADELRAEMAQRGAV